MSLLPVIFLATIIYILLIIPLVVGLFSMYYASKQLEVGNVSISVTAKILGFYFVSGSLFFIVLWASVLGILGGLIIIKSNRQKMAAQIAFGPWISLATFLVWWKPTLFGLNMVLDRIF